MGLGTKIKEALSSDHHDKTGSHSPTYNDNKTPGGFPSDELSPKKHRDGKDYDAHHGVAVGGHNTTKATSGTHGATGLTGTGTTGTVPGASTIGATGTQHHKLRKTEDPTSLESSHDLATGGVSHSQGSPTRGHHTTTTGDKLHRSRFNEHETTASSTQDPYWGSKTTGTDHGTHKGSSATRGHDDLEGIHGPHSSRLANAADPRIDSDRDNRGAPHSGTTGSGVGAAGIGAVTGKNLPERPLHGQEFGFTDTTDSQYDHNPQNQAIGGGVYNSVAGAGSGQDPQYRINHSDTHQHSALSTGTTGATGGSYGQRDDAYNESATTSRNDHAGHGLTGVGAAAGAGAGAGMIGQHNRHQDDNNNNRYDDIQSSHNPDNFSSNIGSSGNNHSSHVPGLPRGSMLDPEPSRTNPTSNQTSGSGHDNADGVSRGEVHGHGKIPNSHTNNYDHNNARTSGGYGSPEGQNSGQGIGQSQSQSHGVGDLTYHHPQEQQGHVINTGSGYDNNNNQSRRSAFGSSASPTSASGMSSGGLGKDHFGPAHEGAKVMHKCECGRDNDISHYFKKDAVYRIGS